MLDIVFGRESVPCGRFVLDGRYYFTKMKLPGWFEDPFIKRVINGVDGAEVLFEEALKNRWGHGISTEMLSTGCKVLCCLYFDALDKVFFATQMGNNCIPYYMEIARSRDIMLCYEHFADMPGWCFEEGLVRLNGVVLTEDAYEEAYMDWVERETKNVESLIYETL